MGDAKNTLWNVDSELCVNYEYMRLGVTWAKQKQQLVNLAVKEYQNNLTKGVLQSRDT